MIERRPDYYTQFHCLGGACPDTCCRDWAVVLDEDALADYAAAPAPLGERIARNLATGGDGDVCFRLDEAGLCALLTPGGLCAIQKDWGEAHLCAHCAAYPRFTEEYGCLTETALAVSCPEAARLLLEAPRFSLVETYDGVDDPPFDGVDPGLLSMLEVSRAAYLALLSCGPNPFWEKLRVLLSCTQVLQARIDAGNYSALDVWAPAAPPPSACWSCSPAWTPCVRTGPGCCGSGPGSSPPCPRRTMPPFGRGTSRPTPAGSASSPTWPAIWCSATGTRR